MLYSSIFFVGFFIACNTQSTRQAPVVSCNGQTSEIVMVSSGDTVTCTCSGDGVINFQWYKAGQALQNETGRDCVIKDFTEADQRMFECSADDTVSANRVMLRSEPAAPLPATITTTSSLLVHGESTTLTCESFGATEFRFLVDFSDVVQDYSSASTLLISSFGARHVGSYFCEGRAASGIPSDSSARIMLSLFNENGPSVDQVTLLPLLAVEQEAVDVSAVLAGSDVTLLCDYLIPDGETPSYYWNYNSDGHPADKELSYLHIGSFQAEHEGEYSCRVNLGGVFSYTSNVIHLSVARNGQTGTVIGITDGGNGEGSVDENNEGHDIVRIGYIRKEDRSGDKDGIGDVALTAIIVCVAITVIVIGVAIVIVLKQKKAVMTVAQMNNKQGLSY